MDIPVVLKAKDREVIDTEWGRLIWFASEKLGNSEDMTIGQCFIKPGQANPLHSHPNCSETIYVIEGFIKHTAEGGEVRMEAGDTITVPPNFPHQARNIGDSVAVLAIAFSSADRQTNDE